LSSPYFPSLSASSFLSKLLPLYFCVFFFLNSCVIYSIYLSYIKFGIRAWFWLFPTTITIQTLPWRGHDLREWNQKWNDGRNDRISIMNEWSKRCPSWCRRWRNQLSWWQQSLTRCYHRYIYLRQPHHKSPTPNQQPLLFKH